jgi:F-type H+-transporting ATPase subunit delta
LAGKIEAKRYARAVFELAVETGKPEVWQADLQKMAGLLQFSDFVAAVENPGLPATLKNKLLAAQLGKINIQALNLGYILVNRGKYSLVKDISEEFQQMLDEYRGIERATVQTAVPLTEKEKQTVITEIEEITGKKITIAVDVNPKIVGGIIVRVGGQLIDGSTSSKLAALRRDLAGISR